MKELQDAVQRAEQNCAKLNARGKALEYTLNLLNNTPLQGFEVAHNLIACQGTLSELIRENARSLELAQDALGQATFELKAKKARRQRQDDKAKESTKTRTKADLPVSPGSQD